jgi:hypothetical protein
MASTHLVLRRIAVAEGRDHFAGARVDASAWANRRLLEDEEYIRPLTAEELEQGDPAPLVPPARVEVREVGNAVVPAPDAVPPAGSIQVDVVGLVDKGTADVRVTVAAAAEPPAEASAPAPASKKKASKKTP